MKDFIQNRLRVLLEAVTNRDSDLDIPSILKFGPSYVYDSKKMLYMISIAKQLSGKMPNDVLQTNYGNGAYTFKLTETKSGYFTFYGVPTTKHFDAGNFKESQGGKSIYLYTMACSKYPEGETESCTTVYNPAVDAKIKILTDPVLGQKIMDFINKSLGYLDDKGEEIRQAKMTPDEIVKLAGKEDLYTKRASQTVSYDEDEGDILNKLNDLKIARLQSTSNEEKKKIRGIEKQLNDKLLVIRKEKNKRRSSNL